jgi:hypothetical protein
VTPKWIRFAAITTFLAVAGAACGGGSNDDTLPAPEPPTTAAASLRVALDSGFRTHVYLLGLATEDALTLQVKGYEGVAEALDENTLALGDRFESAYGKDAEKRFVSAWRPMTDLFVAYGALKFRKKPLTKVEKAFAKFEESVASVGGKLTPLISPRGMATRTRDFVAAMRAVVDAQVIKDYKKADERLRAAADAVGELATAFSRAFADDLPSLYAGDPRSAASTWRTSIDSYLVANVCLVGATIENSATGQIAARDGAKAALASSGAAFAKQIASIYGPTSESAFLPLWKRQADLLLAYAGNAKDKTKKAKSIEDLRQYAKDFASFMHGLSGGIDAAAMTKLMQATIDTLQAMIDAQVKGDPKGAGAQLRKAAGQIEAVGAALAEATVQAFPARFRATATP